MRLDGGAAAAIVDDAGRVLLIKENYDRRRYGFPGGAIDSGETPEATVVRETFEETLVEVAVDHLVGVYRFDNGLAAAVFRCSIVSGVPTRPETGEIAAVGWFAPDAIPIPMTNLLHYALSDVLSGAQRVAREGLRRVT